MDSQETRIKAGVEVASITFYFLTTSALKITVMGTEAAKFLMRFYHTLKMAQGHMDVGK